MACIVASVPVFVNRSVSIHGMASRIASAAWTSTAVVMAKTVPRRGRFRHGVDDGLMAVAEDDGPKTELVVDVPFPVHVEGVRTFAAIDDERVFVTPVAEAARHSVDQRLVGAPEPFSCLGTLKTHLAHPSWGTRGTVPRGQASPAILPAGTDPRTQGDAAAAGDWPHPQASEPIDYIAEQRRHTNKGDRLGPGSRYLPRG